jgi:hypothetical protein
VDQAAIQAVTTGAVISPDRNRHEDALVRTEPLKAACRKVLKNAAIAISLDGKRAWGRPVHLCKVLKPMVEFGNKPTTGEFDFAEFFWYT